MSLLGDPTSAMAWATIVLVVVTICYAIITNSILNETRKGREIKYIERKLEKFYLPLQNALKVYADDENDRCDYTEAKATSLNKKLSEVENYNYLASPELKKLIRPFQNAFFYRNSLNEPMYNKMVDLLEKIEKRVDKDVEGCREKLDN